jgi:hypothetical protein
MIESATIQTLAAANINRRRHARITGPFDGVRIGALDTPLRIFDLSRGGCFVNATHEQAPNINFVMKIDLPHVGLIKLKAETLHRRSGFGFAVRFVGMSEETASVLEEALEKLQSGDQYDE